MGTGGCVELYLVRHGVTLWNKERRYLGQKDQPLLSDKMHSLDGLKEILKTIDFHKIYCSDLIRCKQTLEYIYPGYKAKAEIGNIHYDCRLREYDFGDWEGKTYDMLKEDAAYRNWLDDWDKVTPPQGESGDFFKSRLDSCIMEILSTVEIGRDVTRILLVAHGGVMRYVLSTWVRGYSFWDGQMKNGSAYVLSLSQLKGEWNCCSWSEALTPESERSSGNN